MRREGPVADHPDVSGLEDGPRSVLESAKVRGHEVQVGCRCQIGRDRR